MDADTHPPRPPRLRRPRELAWAAAGLTTAVVALLASMGLSAEPVIDASPSPSSAPLGLESTEAPAPQPTSSWVPQPRAVDYPLYGSTRFVRYLEAELLSHSFVVDVSYWTERGDGATSVDDALHEALTQNPYIYVASWMTHLDRNDKAVSVQVEYGYSTEESARRQADTKAAVDEAISTLSLDALADAQKVTAIHDYIARAATYDWDAWDAAAAGELATTDDSQQAFGVLVGGTAVCNGYAQAFRAIASATGLDAVTVTGPVTQDGAPGLHAWNRVYVDGEWRVVDVTWDDDDRGKPLRDFLLIPMDDPLLDSRTPNTDWVVDQSLTLFE